MPGCVSLVNFHATREKPLADDQAYRMSSPSKYLKQLCAGCGGLCNGILIIAEWRKNGTLIAEAVVLVGVIVLWGCTPRSSADTSESGRKGFYNYLACMERVNRNQEELQTFVSAHTGKEMTPKEEFTLSMLTDRAKNGVGGCEAHIRSETQK